MKPISHLCTAALLIALASASPHALAAPAADATQPAAARPRIGLVLSGGGARGLSHVGVLKVLERERIPVDVIAGTSMGAIVGGLYASGMSAQQVEHEVLRLDWGGVFTSRVERRELTQRRKEQDTEVAPLLELGLGADGLRAPLAPVSSWQLEAHLRRLTLPARQVADFDRLPTPFRAVATDMETGQPVILQSGDLATALRSSMSVPGVFAPVEVEGRLLGDGGLVNNTPVDVARAMGAQRLIVVNIGTPLARREALSTLTGVTGQMINILTEQNVQRSLASLSPQDVLIAPVLDGLSAADFERAVELMNQGEIQAEALVLRMQDLKLSEADYARWLAKRQARQAAPQPLREVRFAGSKHTHPEHLSAALETRAGDVFDVAKAERDLRRLAATGDYVRTDFQLQGPAPGEPPGDTLTFRVEDKPWGPNYLQLGLDFAVDTHGRSAFNLKLAHNRHWLDDSGAEWRNFVRLGTSPALGTEWWRPVPVLAGTLPGGLRPFVSAHAGLERRSTELWAQPQGEVALSVVRQQRQWGADVGLAWRELGEFRLGWLQENGHDEPELTSPEWQGLRTEQRWRERGLRWRAAFDQLDSAYFPTQGWRLDAQYVHGKRQVDGGGGAAWQTMAHWDANLLAVRSWGAHTVQGQVRLAGGSGALPDLPRYGLGGFGQMSAYAADQLSGQQVALLRLGYAYKLGQAPLTRGLYVGANVELGQAAQRWGELGQGSWEPGASLYLGADTAMGPVHAGLGLAQGLRPTLMLVVGRP